MATKARISKQAVLTYISEELFSLKKEDQFTEISYYANTVDQLFKQSLT